MVSGPVLESLLTILELKKRSTQDLGYSHWQYFFKMASKGMKIMGIERQLWVKILNYMLIIGILINFVAFF